VKKINGKLWAPIAPPPGIAGSTLRVRVYDPENDQPAAMETGTHAHDEQTIYTFGCVLSRDAWGSGLP